MVLAGRGTAATEEIESVLADVRARAAAGMTGTPWLLMATAIAGAGDARHIAEFARHVSAGCPETVLGEVRSRLEKDARSGRSGATAMLAMLVAYRSDPPEFDAAAQWMDAAVADGCAEAPEALNALTEPAVGIPEPAAARLPDEAPEKAPTIEIVAAADEEPTTTDVERLLASSAFGDQIRLAGRIVVKQEQIGALLDALLAVPSRELTLAQAAAVLELPTGRVQGALLQVKRVLDVEGYEVLAIDGPVVRLDERTLREQFGLDIAVGVSA
ncbi:hypothetical protein [Speluncibacter jeojiensis]|uniref:Alkaline phosphatase-like protein PglZ C-terminal domain-containing protein n=1 Tax=Speluncibacter jeojiensis TaxID=2710754 RepID=A0A9X4M2W3_9ACTN|nr:hypothetical protein [Corynebacteriales bacterium D3-21]